MDEQLVPVGSFTATLAVKNTNVTDEIGRAGASFGNLVLMTADAVADTQKKLNETGANTATELANTLVDVIALQEKVFDDQGNVSQIKTYVEKLPLVNFIDPVFYQWSQVRLQGLFFAREFASTTSDSSIDTSANGSVGINFWGVQGGYNAQVNTSQVNTDSDNDLSYGNVRVNALLGPRTDISIRKPTQVIQGPRLAIIHGSIVDEKNGDKITARTMDVLIQYHRRDGTPIKGKSISIDSPGVSWVFAGEPVTDSHGNLQIKLRREFLDEDADTSMKDFVVSARIGILQNNSTVTF